MINAAIPTTVSFADVSGSKTYLFPTFQTFDVPVEGDVLTVKGARYDVDRVERVFDENGGTIYLGDVVYLRAVTP